MAIGGWGLWVWDPSRGVVEQLPPSLGLRRIHQQPAWSPGDSLLAFAAFLDGPQGLFTYRLRDGRLDTLRTGRVDDVAWTPGGDTVVYRMGAGAERLEAEVHLHVRSSGHDERLFAVPATDPIWQTLEVSPDGRWLLYSSTLSGVDDLYVRAWPKLDAPRRVTSAGGLQGHWSEGGDTIFYRAGAHELMAVPFGADGPGSLGTAASLGGSDDLLEFWGLDGESGQFLRQERLEADRAPPIRLVTNWIARAEGRVR